MAVERRGERIASACVEVDAISLPGDVGARTLIDDLELARRVLRQRMPKAVDPQVADAIRRLRERAAAFLAAHPTEASAARRAQPSVRPPTRPRPRAPRSRPRPAMSTSTRPPDGDPDSDAAPEWLVAAVVPDPTHPRTGALDRLVAAMLRYVVGGGRGVTRAELVRRWRATPWPIPHPDLLRRVVRRLVLRSVVLQDSTGRLRVAEAPWRTVWSSGHRVRYEIADLGLPVSAAARELLALLRGRAIGRTGPWADSAGHLAGLLGSNAETVRRALLELAAAGAIVPAGEHQTRSGHRLRAWSVVAQQPRPLAGSEGRMGAAGGPPPATVTRPLAGSAVRSLAGSDGRIGAASGPRAAAGAAQPEAAPDRSQGRADRSQDNQDSATAEAQTTPLPPAPAATAAGGGGGDEPRQEQQKPESQQQPTAAPSEPPRTSPATVPTATCTPAGARAALDTLRDQSRRRALLTDPRPQVVNVQDLLAAVGFATENPNRQQATANAIADKRGDDAVRWLLDLLHDIAADPTTDVAAVLAHRLKNRLLDAAEPSSNTTSQTGSGPRRPVQHDSGAEIGRKNMARLAQEREAWPADDLRGRVLAHASDGWLADRIAAVLGVAPVEVDRILADQSGQAAEPRRARSRLRAVSQLASAGGTS